MRSESGTFGDECLNAREDARDAPRLMRAVIGRRAQRSCSWCGLQRDERGSLGLQRGLLPRPGLDHASSSADLGRCVLRGPKTRWGRRIPSRRSPGRRGPRRKRWAGAPVTRVIANRIAVVGMRCFGAVRPVAKRRSRRRRASVRSWSRRSAAAMLSRRCLCWPRRGRGTVTRR